MVALERRGQLTSEAVLRLLAGSHAATQELASARAEVPRQYAGTTTSGGLFESGRSCSEARTPLRLPWTSNSHHPK